MNNKNKLKAIIAFAVALAFILPTSAVFANKVTDEGILTFGNTIVSIDPATKTVVEGTSFDVEVYIEPGEPVCGVELFKIYYNASAITATDVTYEGFFDPYDIYSMTPDLSVPGVITGICELTQKTETVNVSNVFCTISFTADNVGNSAIDIDANEAVIIRPDNSAVPLVVNDGEVTVIPVYYALDVTIIGNGTVAQDPLPDVSPNLYEENTTVTLTPDADLGWTFVGFGGDDFGEIYEGSYKINMTKDMSINATFTEDEYTLTVTIIGNGSVNVDPAGPYTYGNVVTLTAIADPGWTFGSWSGDLSGSELIETIVMDDNKGVTATFTEDEYTLTVTIIGNGSVNVDPAGPYTYGNVVTLTAIADPGWTFGSWSGDLSGSELIETIVMDGNKGVTATFTEDQYILDVTIVGSGSVDVDPAGPYTYGTVVTLTAIADPGWIFDSWSGDLSGSELIETIVMDGNKGVTATFIHIEYTLNVTIIGNGGVAKAPDQPTYHYGDLVELTATADLGWTFVRWSGDVPIGYEKENPLDIMIYSDKEITAVFDQGWSATLNFDVHGLVDDVIFGEQTGATDGKDPLYDIPKPGMSPSPYTYAYFDAGLSPPYNRLYQDYREYPGVDYKVWDLYVICDDTVPNTELVISWNTSDLADIGYTYIGLYNYDATVLLADMKNSASYMFTAEYGRLYHFQIVCSENHPPVLDSIGNKSVDEEELLTFTLTASDPDVPSQTLTFSAINMPAGAMLDAVTGVFEWMPSESQGDIVYNVTFKVTDDGDPLKYDDETITITVNEVNKDPVLDPIGDKSVDEEILLTFTLTASDPDLPANTLTFSAINLPTGATLDAVTGVFTWIPDESQGPDAYSITFKVTDDDGAFDSETITIIVRETNHPPVLDPIGDKSVNEEILLTFTLTASDQDIPAQTLTFSAINMPAGATLDPVTGVFEWTPTELQDGVYSVTFRVADDGAMFDEEPITITVYEVNKDPVLDPIGDKSVNEMTLLTFVVTASDSDIPANTLKFSVAGAPGAVIDEDTGVFEWTPTELQDGVYTVTFTVTDDGIPVKSDSETITITVYETNRAPVLGSIGNKQVNEEVLLTINLGANDPDVPMQTLTFSATDMPDGAMLDPVTGVFTWEPTELQDGVYSVTFRVTDSGMPAMFDDETITITVYEVNQPPVLDSIGDKEVNEEELLTFTVTASDSDIPAQTLTFSVMDKPDGATFDTVTGVFEWIPDESQGPGSYDVTFTVTDGALFDFETITITVYEVHHVALQDGWNLFSLPFGESVDKADVIVRWCSVDYTWDEAANSGIILWFAYNWSGSLYASVNTFIPGDGYWMWAYHDCEILMASNILGNSADLQISWNMIGMPYNESVNKIIDVTVQYNSVDYSWDDATSEPDPIILTYIYGWNRAIQKYELSETFEPGHGYWMYAFKVCTLKI